LLPQPHVHREHQQGAGGDPNASRGLGDLERVIEQQRDKIDELHHRLEQYERPGHAGAGDR
jgi:hypothetical protein